MGGAGGGGSEPGRQRGDNIIGVVEGMDETARAREIRFFGQPTRVELAILMATGDMHEHLGQMIAYARTNRIVPPWSQ